MNLKKAGSKLTKPKEKIRWHDVEMLTSIDGLDFVAVCSKAVVAIVDTSEVLVACREDLLASKIVASRQEDQDDIDFLQRK